MRRIQFSLIAMLLLVMTACESSLDFTFDPTEIEIAVTDDAGNALEGALVKVFDNEGDYNEELNTGNSNLEFDKGFTDASGKVIFGGDENYDSEKDHYFYVSFRDRERFADLDNFNKNYKLSKDNLRQGGKSRVTIGLEQAKSAVSFYSKEIPESSLPLSILIDGEEVGELTKLSSSDPSNPNTNDASVLSFRLGQGTRSWMAISTSGCIWQGEVEIGSTETFTPISITTCEAGSVTFWVDEASADLLPIAVSLSPNDEVGSITTASATAPSDCFEPGYLSVSRATGDYTYYATSANGNCVWSGQLVITTDNCQTIKLSSCE